MRPSDLREQTLAVLTELRKQLPFPLLGFDMDKHNVFMNETLKAYCDRPTSSSRAAGPTGRTTRCGWTKPAMQSNSKPAGDSDLKPATRGVVRMGQFHDVVEGWKDQATD